MAETIARTDTFKWKQVGCIRVGHLRTPDVRKRPAELDKPDLGTCADQATAAGSATVAPKSRGGPPKRRLVLGIGFTSREVVPFANANELAASAVAGKMTSAVGRHLKKLLAQIESIGKNNKGVDLAFRAGQMAQAIKMVQSGILQQANRGAWDKRQRRAGSHERQRNSERAWAVVQSQFEQFMQSPNNRKLSKLRACRQFMATPAFCRPFGLNKVPTLVGDVPEHKRLPALGTVVKRLRMPRTKQ